MSKRSAPAMRSVVAPRGHVLDHLAAQGGRAAEHGDAARRRRRPGSRGRRRRRPAPRAAAPGRPPPAVAAARGGRGRAAGRRARRTGPAASASGKFSPVVTSTPAGAVGPPCLQGLACEVGGRLVPRGATDPTDAGDPRLELALDPRAERDLAAGHDDLAHAEPLELAGHAAVEAGRGRSAARAPPRRRRAGRRPARRGTTRRTRRSPSAPRRSSGATSPPPSPRGPDPRCAGTPAAAPWRSRG